MSTSRRVRVDLRPREGFTLCVDLAPEVFDPFNDDLATCDLEPSDALWDSVTRHRCLPSRCDHH